MWPISAQLRKQIQLNAHWKEIGTKAFSKSIELFPILPFPNS